MGRTKKPPRLHLRDLLARELLEKLYHEEGMTLVQIANRFGDVPQTVLKLMQVFEIPRRLRSAGKSGALPAKLPIVRPEAEPSPLARRARNYRSSWTPDEVEQLRRLALENVPTRIIAIRLGRSIDGVRGKAETTGISLRGRRKP